MRPVLDYPSVVEHDDTVGPTSRLQTVGDQDRRAPGGHHAHGPGHPGLGGQVQVGGRLVEQQQSRVDQLGPSQRDQLPLSVGQRPAPLGHPVQVAAGQPGHQFVGPHGTRCRLHLGVGRVGPAVGDVVPDRPGEQEAPPGARTRADDGRPADRAGEGRRRRPVLCPWSDRRSGSAALSPWTYPPRFRRPGRRSGRAAISRSTPRSARRSGPVPG